MIWDRGGCVGVSWVKRERSVVDIDRWVYVKVLRWGVGYREYEGGKEG